MANYNQFKKAWDSMNDTQRKQAVEQNKNNAQFQQFAQQYNNEVNGGSVNVQQVVQQANKNGNLNNTTTQGTNTQGSTTTNQNQTNANGTNGQNNTNNSEINNGGTTGTDKSVVSQDFDQSRLTNDNAQVSVKEGTASQTGMPDYELNSDARDNEIVNNLNAYINSNPEFFTDRNTFNQSFHYSERNSRQKALLDSFWKGQEDKKTASNYNTGDAIATGMKNSDITPDIMNLIRQNNPEAYAEWQKQMQEEINKRIANFTTPADPYSTADLFKSLVEKLNIEPEDPLQIYDNWYGMCERLGVFKDSEKLANQQAQIEANHKQIENITKKYSSNAGGATSSALSAARLNKALQPYLAIESSLQNEYSLLLQGRNSNLAIANQSANAMVMQANENQRIFNQKLSGLGFAVTTASFRTHEQTLQNQLNYQSALNDLNLLNQSKQNDLARYNLYANTKLQNQLNSELQDLNTEDENQLRSNLNNILSQYYSAYGDIIQRSQPQVVDDILKYAKEKGISVGEALTQNFIKPLQSKPEFQQKVRSSYGMNVSQSLGTIGGDNVIVTHNPDGTISYEVIGDVGTNSYGGGGIGTMRTERNNNPTAMTTDVAKSLGGIEGVDYEVGDSFTTGDGRTLYTAKLIGDPIEKTIELLDRGVSKGAGFKTQKGANRWTYLSQIGINDEKWKGMDYEEKKNVVLKMLQHEGGDINKMLYYNTKQDKDWSSDQYIDYYTMDFEALNKLTDQTKRDIKDHYGSWDKFLEARKQYNEEVIKPQGTKEGNDVLIAMAQLQNLIGRDSTGKLTGKLDTSYSMFSPGNAAGRKLAQLQSLLKLNKLQEAKRGGASFGGMTEGEWSIIGDASTSLSNWLSDEEFKNEFYSVAKAVYKATYGKTLDSNTWMNFVNKYYDGTNSLDLTGPDNNV